MRRPMPTDLVARFDGTLATKFCQERDGIVILVRRLPLVGERDY